MAHYANPHKKCFVQFSTKLCSLPIMPFHTKNALFSFSTELRVIVSGQLADTKHQRQNSVASWEAFYCKRWVVMCCWAVYVVSCKFKSTLKTYIMIFLTQEEWNKSFRKKTNLTNHIIPAQCHHQSQQTFCWFTCILVVLLLELHLVAKPQNIWTISKQPMSQGLKERAMNGWTSSSSSHCTTIS